MVRTIIDLLHVGFILVVPLALMVSDGEHLGKRRGAYDSPCDQLLNETTTDAHMQANHVPVKLAYCLNTSWGLGPSRKKTSMMPDSLIQWV
jgi:hypothetical protein